MGLAWSEVAENVAKKQAPKPVKQHTSENSSSSLALVPDQGSEAAVLGVSDVTGEVGKGFVKGLLPPSFAPPFREEPS